MDSVLDFLCAILMAMYWIFRILVTALSYLRIDFPFTSMNVNLEIVMLFITLICIICVFKRKTIGGIIYFGMYCAYFGPSLYATIKAGITPHNISFAVVDFLGILLAAVVMLNIIWSKTRVVTVKKDVEWFYNGKQYDRELDSRADKNQYKIY